MTLASFGHDHFAGAPLQHQRRTDCLVRIANHLQRHPGGSLPDKVASPKDYKALVRLANRPEVTHAAVLQPHRRRTLRLVAECDATTVLLVHDTTELDYSGLTSLAGHLGQIGNGRGQGYLCHNTLAVNPHGREVLGLAHQILHCRDRVSPTESVAAKRLRQSRESRLWTQAVQQLGPLPPGKRIVDVADRGADVFEFLAWEVKHQRRFVIRSTHNRTIEVAGQPDTSLHDYARTLPALGTRLLPVQGRNGAADRTVRVSVAAAAVRVRPPHVRRGDYDRVCLDLWVVRVWESDPPSGSEPIEWVLLSNVPAETVVEAWERVDWYQCRWVVEEFHKAQKTGCGIEELQFTTVAALEPMIALLSVVAVTLLNLRDASRQPEAATRLASTVVAPAYVTVLSRWRYREERPGLTVREFFQALARLGGHQNRRGDAPPGWQVLWRGWMKLQMLQTGYELCGQR